MYSGTDTSKVCICKLSVRAAALISPITAGSPQALHKAFGSSPYRAIAMSDNAVGRHTPGLRKERKGQRGIFGASSLGHLARSTAANQPQRLGRTDAESKASTWSMQEHATGRSEFPLAVTSRVAPPNFMLLVLEKCEGSVRARLPSAW